MSTDMTMNVLISLQELPQLKLLSAAGVHGSVAARNAVDAEIVVAL